MRTLLTISAVCVMLALCASVAMAKPDEEGYERVPLVSHTDLDITLLVRPIASAADEAFIGFLIFNKTGAPLEIPLGTNANFRIDEVVRLDRVTRTAISTGSLSGGNDYDLFHRDMMVLNTKRPPLPIDESRHVEALSDRTLGGLGIVAQGSNGLTIQGRFHFSLLYKGLTLTTPREGVPIQFDWVAPDDAGIERMKTRLVSTLRGGDPGGRRYNVMATYLDHPAIGPSVPPQDLIAGLEAWEQHGEKILEYIDAHRNPDDGLVEYALRLIERRDYLRMLVLCRSTSLHDARLIEPLTAWATGQPDFQGAESALTLLSKQMDLAADRDALTKELGKAWLERSPAVRSGTLKPNEAWRWTKEVHLLALTRDRNLIPILLPYLDRKEIVVDARQNSAVNDGVSTRACDAAYNAILDVLGREGERFDIHFGWPRPGDMKPADAHAHRDAAIATLRRELSAR